ncbi:acyl-CoA carboxylase subunit epsilon [Umezawaea beigongshangensis]|uniref:acyl-CoA carboxylase subunit epsilon n=1 Tax=Umezawaea beigongshangensis TaxID=2780383 RepID=UPI0018F239A9|nr:acyl-CoA carboxylase subunit epsilon [Umezawaea beigongshangensis]
MSAGPPLRVVRGTPDDAELAALTVVVAALASAPPEKPVDAPRSAWSDPGRRMRTPPRPGPGAWRASALPS